MKREADNALIKEALDRYPKSFFQQFGFTEQHLARQALEQHIQSCEDPREIQLMLISMVRQAYQLNDLIPNIEMLVYKIFISPDLTKKIRKEQDSADLLAGSLFAKPDTKFGPLIYKSLLETAALYPKKKHLKKIIEHVIKFEGPEDTSPETIDQIIRICIDQKLPILLG